MFSRPLRPTASNSCYELVVLCSKFHCGAHAFEFIPLFDSLQSKVSRIS